MDSLKIRERTWRFFAGSALCSSMVPKIEVTAIRAKMIIANLTEAKKLQTLSIADLLLVLFQYKCPF